jgi:hypothetical protein
MDSAVMPPPLLVPAEEVLPPLLVPAVEALPPLVVPAVEMPLPAVASAAGGPLTVACAALLPWSSASRVTVSLSEAATSSPLSSVPSGWESCPPNTAAKVS